MGAWSGWWWWKVQIPVYVPPIGLQALPVNISLFQLVHFVNTILFTGCRLMLKRDTFLERDIMMNTLMCIADWDGTVPMPSILKPRPLWAGKQVWRIT